MPDPIHNLNDLMGEIEGASIETSAGRYVRVDHVERLLEKQRQAAEEEKQKKLDEPPPRTMTQARGQAARFLKNQGLGDDTPSVGRSIPASDSQPPSRA